MEWVLQNPQIHSTFGNLGFSVGDGYHINENCNAALETILHNILTEDKYLRTFRRGISFGQNIIKDLIPLLIHTKEDKTVELLVKILVNLTIPIECLLSVDVISKTDFGRHTAFEINNLLASTKAAFTDNRVTKVLIDFLKKNLDNEQKQKLSPENCTNISNCLLLLRNILHIPEEASSLSPNSYNISAHTVQNQILWNIFSQSIDKILIKLMTISEAGNWGVTMVQLIALLYKDQHVVNLHKLINLWLETSLSESSEDNESNTSPADRSSDDSSLKFTSDPTSDSSDTGGSGKSNDEPNSVNNGWDMSSVNSTSEIANEQPFLPPPEVVDKPPSLANISESMECNNGETIKSNNDKESSCSSTQAKKTIKNKTDMKTALSENSDYGYGTQIENQESISTSSNEDEVPVKKPVHQKPHNPKQRVNTKVRINVSLQERKRKKVVKRGKANIINVQGLSHKTPTDDDISNILKEFTVDFLLKGYNSLVQTLHSQIMNNLKLEIDTSHFFWLVTYFLKFATQIELDLKHICFVLSYDIISYLIAEGVNLCEQFELAIKLDGNDLKPSMRRIHLVVTAIREYVQAIEVYKKFSHIENQDQESLVVLQVKMCETEELRSLLVLLLRHHNSKYHSKQYLQDLIVTNHILLLFLDGVMRLPNFNGSTNMSDHIKQFATPEIMYQYGLLLEDYLGNGEFVNDCIFTIMHHVGGELGSHVSLFQPKILKTFTSIWKSEYEICDDWSDLIEYMINTFIKKPHTLQSPANVWIDKENLDEDKIFRKPVVPEILQAKTEPQEPKHDKKKANAPNTGGSTSSKDRWTEDELSSLSWNYMQCSSSPDVIAEIIKMFKEDGIIKSRESVIRELYKQKLITKDSFETGSKGESSPKTVQAAEEMRKEEISKLCEQLKNDGKSKFLDWVQKVLLETCFAKICLEKKAARMETSQEENETKVLNFEIFKQKKNDLPVISPISYRSLNYNQSIPLVPWNCEQAAICKDLKFLQLLHKLGFHMPVDTGKVFIRIPHFWTADFLYEIAGKVAPIDTSKLKFSASDILVRNSTSVTQDTLMMPEDLGKNITLMAAPENFYQIHKQKHLGTMVNFTPMPGSSFNSDSGENQKQNWLELVQKSQECKLTLNLRSCSVGEEDVEMRPELGVVPAKVAGVLAPPPHLPPHPPPPAPHPPHPQHPPHPPHPPLILPTVMTTKHDHDTAYGVPEPEFYNNSLCETASVASDLTRMYVSDEDDKPEVLIIPKMPSMVDNCTLDNSRMDHASADSDSATAEKRPRL